jgi:enoyl-[acyl-carrier-protein] reductase (NADH)
MRPKFKSHAFCQHVHSSLLFFLDQITLQVVAKRMVENGQGGSIVNISSAASTGALEDHSAYCPSKAAVDMLTKCMALELGPHKVRYKYNEIQDISGMLVLRILFCRNSRF